MTRRKAASLLLATLGLTLSAGTHASEPLPGTKRLSMEGDLASQMVEGIERFLLRETEASIQRRPARWKRDTSSAERYAGSVAPNRDRLVRILGVVDPREKVEALDLTATTSQPALV